MYLGISFVWFKEIYFLKTIQFSLATSISHTGFFFFNLTSIGLIILSLTSSFNPGENKSKLIDKMLFIYS